MLFSVVGSSGLGAVAGTPVHSVAALLRVVADRPDQQVIVLAPAYAATSARQQADLVAAARPAARVEVLVSRHHALTLTLVAHQVLDSLRWSAGIDDGLSALHRALASARSLVWSPSAWRLRGTGLTLAARLRGLGGAGASVVELGSPARFLDARHGRCPSLGERLYGAVPTTALLARQLGGSPEQVAVEIHAGAPYGTRGAQLLTALPAAPAVPRESEAA